MEVWRFLFGTPKSAKAIVFYAEYEGSYPSFEGIIRELVKNRRQPITYITSDPTDSILTRNDPLIHVFCLKTLLPSLMVLMNSKVVVLTLVGLNMHDIKRSVKDVSYVYVFHSIHSCNTVYEFGAFEHYDSVLCVGQHHVEELKKQEELYGFKKKVLVEAGYYRIERIHAAYKKYVQAHSDSPDRKPAVLFAPSWEDNFVLEHYAEQIITGLRDADYEVIVRLHPETRRRYPEWIDAFEKKFMGDPGFTLEQLITTDDSLFRADVLITDWSGIAPEYAYGTERPVLFLDGVPKKINNDRYEELEIDPIEFSLRQEIGIVVPVDAANETATYVKELLTRREEFKERILESRSKNIFHFRESSAIGASHILELIGEEIE